MAPSITNYQEIQRDEIEALRSIYNEDFSLDQPKKGAWNKTSDRGFRISLRATTDEQDDPSIVLRAAFPKHVHFKTKKNAEDVARQLPKTLLGSEMIYDITAALQDILDQEPRVELHDGPTLDEERNANEETAKQRMLEKEAQERLEALTLAKKQEADQERQLLHQLELQQRARAERRHAASNEVLIHRSSEGDETGVVTFDTPSKVRYPGGRLLAVKDVFRPTLFRQHDAGRLYLVSPHENIEHENTAAFLCLKQYALEEFDPSFRAALQDLESRLEAEVHSAQHANVSKPLNFSIRRSESSPSARWIISLLVYFTPKSSLQELLLTADCLDARRTKAWSVQMLEGLHSYHQQGVAHGAVHVANVLLWETEALTTTIQWSDGRYGLKMRTLTGSKRKHIPSGWEPSEIQQAKRDEVSSNTDIWFWGVCIIQMAFGLGIVNEYANPTEALRELNLSTGLKSMFQSIFVEDSKQRPSAWDLLHSGFLRSDEPLSSEGNLSNSMKRPRQRRESELPTELSEYSRKFIEEGRLGRGGFGEVFRARNRTDGQLYAVKKIKADSRTALNPVLSETSVLSRLNHPHVVRYFSSWIEDEPSSTDLESSQPEVSQTETFSSGDFSLHHDIPYSSRGLDFISSNHVVFGGAEDSESDDDSNSDLDDNERGSSPANGHNISNSESNSNRSERQNAPARPSFASQRTTLYIQMEYCNQETLRNLINSGIQANVAESWRILRQIVLGLAHIHSASIVHRDLKPENIFVDNNGDVRIGDFGLARPGQYTSTPGRPETTNAVSWTKDVGTAWYVAPEVRSGKLGSYNEKADLYSLGIIFYEMNVRFETGMERAETLNSFATRQATLLPPSLSTPEKALQAEVFQGLVNHDPLQRLGCANLLRIIPVQDEDQASILLRRELHNRSSQFRSQAITTLFAQEPIEKDWSESSLDMDVKDKLRVLDGMPAMSRSLPDLDMQTKVKRQLIKIFRIHAAIERTDGPAVFPHHPYYNPLDVVRFLDSSGNMLQLPYDLVLPNAVLLARSARTERKTYAFGDVYRPVPFKDKPNIFGEVDFDIMSTTSQHLRLEEAESIKVIDEIIDSFPNLASTNMCYHLNHSHLLEKILESSNIERAKWFATKESLSKLNTGDWTWSKVRHELRSPPLALPSVSLDELERFDFREPVHKAIPKLRLMIQEPAELETSFSHISDLSLFLSRLNVQRKIFLSPLTSYNEKFYKGNVYYQCLYDRKRRSVFAAGGRYDKLIRSHQAAPSRETVIHGVGFQMTWSGLCNGMLSYLNTQSKSKAKRRPQLDHSAWTPKKPDVLVDCFDTNLLDNVGLRIVSELWANGISAELATSESSPSTAFTKALSAREEYSWTIMIKSQDAVKVRNTIRQDESEVRVAELGQFMRHELRERSRNEGRNPVPSLSRLDSQQEGVATSQDAEVKVHVFQRKGKKIASRKTVVEDAIAHARDWRKSAVDIPIIAVETRDETFQSLQLARMQDADAWKRVIQTAPAAERQYLSELQDLLQEHQSAGAVFIYNFRSKAILYYPFATG